MVAPPQVEFLEEERGAGRRTHVAGKMIKVFTWPAKRKPELGEVLGRQHSWKRGTDQIGSITTVLTESV